MGSLVDGTAVPAPDAALDEIVIFAHTYHGYHRLGREPEALLELVAPVLRTLEGTREPPPWAGVDLLRGALFYLARMTRHWGDVPPEQEAQMRALVARIGGSRWDVALANDSDTSA